MGDPSVGRIVIVGAGLAALHAAEALRSGGWSGELVMLGDEAHPPYHRPPLSKAWLAGGMAEAQLAMRTPEALAKKGIALRCGASVVAIERGTRHVVLADGERLTCSGLVLATGATARRLALPGANAAGVLTLRSRADADALAAHVARCAEQDLPLVVVGGGFIGLEAAATARKKGVRVTVLESAPRLMGRVLAPLLSQWFADLHRQHGVDVRLGVELTGFESGPDGRVCALHLSEGPALPCGAVLLGVGVAANDGLARDAGLETDRGIVVDACCRTADAAIVAAGDCCARRLDDGRLLRLESVHNATEQGKCAAAALLGQPRPFSGTPWFWSDQYDRKLQMAGLSDGADAWVLRGTMAAAAFSVWHYRQDKLLAVDTVNAPKDHLLARKLLDAGVSPPPAQAADPATDLAAWLAAA